MDLTQALAGRKPGEWVVLDKSRTKVVAGGATPVDAMRKLESEPPETRDALLLMQVPDPTTVCVY